MKNKYRCYYQINRHEDEPDILSCLVKLADGIVRQCSYQGREEQCGELQRMIFKQERE